MNIFFDLDGTLFDISKKYYQAHIIASGSINLKALSFNKYWKAKRIKLPENEILGLESGSKSFRYYEKRRMDLLEDKSLLDLDTPVPKLLSTLRTLKKGYGLYLVTLRRRKKNLLNQLREFKIMNSFEKILTAIPNNNPVLSKVNLIRKIKYSPGDLIIGDTEADISVGRELGIKTVAVSSGIRSKSFLKACKPDFLVSNIKDYFLRY